MFEIEYAFLTSTHVCQQPRCSFDQTNVWSSSDRHWIICATAFVEPTWYTESKPLHWRPRYLRPHSHETFSFATTFIWDHIHLRPQCLRPQSFETTFVWDHSHVRPHSHETFSFETTFTWDHIHLRPHSFETTFIWDHSHLRPQSFETTVIWNHIRLKPHSFETTFVWDHIRLRPHSFELTFILRHIKVKLFWFTVNHIFMIYFHFFAGDLKFWKLTLHLKFCKVAPFRVQGWLTLGCKCTRTLQHRGGQKTLHTSGL